MTQRDTICALASAPGRAGVAVIRISGPGAGDALRQLCGPPPPPRQASLRKIKSPGTGEVLDRGLALWLPGPASFTGEDIAELHIHGGRAVVGRVIDALTSLRGVRLAEPGEFARRAFENGRIDLTEVEGLADLVAAETEAQARQAIAQAEGGARALYESWREELVKAQALAEAGLDFADEADVAADAAVQADAAVAKLLTAISHASRGPERRAPPRRLPRRHRRTAQRRQVVSAECARAARRGNRVGGGGDDPRCHRGPSRLAGITRHRHRHGGDKSCTRCGRG